MDYEKNKEALAIVKQMVADGQISQEVAEKDARGQVPDILD